MKSLRDFFHARKGRFSYLLAVMLAQLLLSPWAETGGGLGRITGLVAAAAVLAALYAISDNREVWIAGLILAVPAFLHRLSVSPDLRGFTALAGQSASIIFDAFITAIILNEILRHDLVGGQTIYGALCAYLTAGYAFAHFYMLLARLDPRSFVLDPHFFQRATPALPDLIYYSYVTLIALGASGITPATPYARCFTMVEGILGVMYLAVLLARLVGLHVSQQILKSYAGAEEQPESGEPSLVGNKAAIGKR